MGVLSDPEFFRCCCMTLGGQCQIIIEKVVQTTFSPPFGSALLGEGFGPIYPPLKLYGLLPAMIRPTYFFINLCNSAIA